jgi:hypothetical protein
VQRLKWIGLFLVATGCNTPLSGGVPPKDRDAALAPIDGAVPSKEASVPDGAPPEVWAAPYDIEAFSQAVISSIQGPNFQRAVTEIDLQNPPFAEVILSVQLESPCSPWSRWDDDPPPSGHNWPLLCDAFDRNFEITLDDPVEEGDPPGVELVRAITPFGGPMAFEIDMTDVANGRPGLHQLRAHISTWPDPSGRVTGAEGQWLVSAQLSVRPGPAPREVLAVLPLANGHQNENSGTVAVPFELPPGTTQARLDYRVTGHGAGPSDGPCIGGAEEFCRRSHQVAIDGQELAVVEPWIRSCQHMCTIATHPRAGFDYCEENPCGALRSVSAPRANWCPGEVVRTFSWTDGIPVDQEPHELTYRVNTIAPGGNWRTSVVLFAYGQR